MSKKRVIFKNRKIICFLLLIMLLPAILFGFLSEESGPQARERLKSYRTVHSVHAGNASQKVFDMDILQTLESPIACRAEDVQALPEIVNRILNQNAVIFGADVHGDLLLAFDGKHLDYHVSRPEDFRCRERVIPESLSAQAPISDTETATRQNATYIINKSLKKIHLEQGPDAELENGFETKLTRAA